MAALIVFLLLLVSPSLWAQNIQRTDFSFYAGTLAGAGNALHVQPGTGAVFHHILDSGSLTSLVPGTGATNAGKAEDAVHASGDTGMAVWGVQQQAAGAPTEFSASAGDYSPIAVDSFGTMSGSLFMPWAWTYHENSSVALTDTTVHASCGTGLFNYISSIAFSTNAATAASILIEDSTNVTILGPYYLEAVAGRGMSINFFPAKKQTNAATLVSVTTTGAIAHGLDIQGFCGR